MSSGSYFISWEVPNYDCNEYTITRESGSVLVTSKLGPVESLTGMPSGGKLPARFEQRVIRDLSVSEQVTPCTSPAGIVRRMKHAATLSDTPDRNHILVRALALPADVCSDEFGISAEEHAALSACGMGAPDSIGRALDEAHAHSVTIEKAAKKQQERAAQEASAPVRIVPHALGLRRISMPLGSRLPPWAGELWQVFGCRPTNAGQGSAIAAGQTTSNPSTRATGFITNWYGISLAVDVTLDGVTFHADSDVVELPRHEVPKAASANDIPSRAWDGILSHIASDLSGWDDSEAQDYTHTDTKKYEALALDHLAHFKPLIDCRAGFYGSRAHLTSECVEWVVRLANIAEEVIVCWLRAADVMKDPAAASDSRFDESAFRTLIKQSRRAGKLFSKGHRPLPVERDDSEAIAAAVADYLKENPTPTSTEVSERIAALGLQDANGRAVAKALKDSGREAKLVPGNGKRDRRWVVREESCVAAE